MGPNQSIEISSFAPTPVQVEASRQLDIDAKCVQVFGPVLAVLGTILWAYGDLAVTVYQMVVSFLRRLT